MKITVGHLVIAVGVGTFVVLGPMGGFRRIDTARNPATTASQSAPVVTEPPKDQTASPDSKPALPFEEKLPAGETEPKDVKETDAQPAAPKPISPDLPAAPAQPETPAVPAANNEAAPAAAAPVEAPAAPAPRPVRRRRVRTKKAAVAAAATAAGENLIGSYVTLKLANGREVKGALVEQTASLYKIELPGLGAMSYPAHDVVSVTPAQ